MSSNSEVHGKRCSLELIKWLIVAILLVIAIVGNYFYSNYNLILRTLAILFIIAIAGSVAAMTAKGRSTIAFAREARAEVRKVIWPTYQETLHTTLIVTSVTAVISLILWGLDSIIFNVVSFITDFRF